MDIYPKNSQSYHKNICSVMFITALLIVETTYKPLNQRMDKEKVRYTYTIEYYSVVKKKNDILKFAGK